MPCKFKLSAEKGSKKHAATVGYKNAVPYYNIARLAT